MKTITELNAKWYWRLTKIIFFSGILFCIGVSFLVVFDSLERDYSPKAVHSLDSNIKNSKARISNLKSRFPDTIISHEELIKDGIDLSDHTWDIGTPQKKDSKNTPITVKDVRYLLAIGKSIPHLNYSGESYDRNICNSEIGSFLKYYPPNQIYLEHCGISSIENFIAKITNYQPGIFNPELYKYFSEEIFYMDYIPLSQKIIGVFYCIMILVFSIIFIFLARALAYYIILGRTFFPRNLQEFLSDFKIKKYHDMPDSVSDLDHVYTDGRGNIILDIEGNVIPLPDNPPFPPSLNKETGELAIFCFDEHGNNIVRTFQLERK